MNRNELVEHLHVQGYSLFMGSNNQLCYVLDLPDGGAAHFAETVKQVKLRYERVILKEGN